jgi:hypothetical protein
MSLYFVFLCQLLSSTVLPLSVPHTVPSVVSVTLWPLLSPRLCPLSVSISSTLCWFSVIESTLVFWSMSNVCHYLTLYRLLFLSTCLLLSSTDCPKSANTSYCTVYCFCFTMSSAAFYSQVNVRQYLTLYRILVQFHYVQCCLLQSVHYLSVPHIVPSLISVSLCPLLSF